ncbi:dynein associated protein-domain-containing protein [Neohortaea acidophila]|uniref:Dynein associated protein-domain-containing protein n=1 Tax=Neohortaea acidophila TaxID=245834 RepID=A0A6A6PGB2_9PEZI|nr:dynein associated protein-domain-containing protein [Neohortaea acidophila]KAF2478975.1 dynein associated protein-domain-containing protein [Neohortaea acidophila]
MTTTAYTVGQKVELNDGRTATIRFAGTTSFQVGEWIGVELEEPTGKNDGSVKGERYFQCRPNYGMFLRPTGVKRVVEDAKPKASGKTVGNGVAGKPRPGVNGVKRQSVVGTPSATPTPATRPGLSGMRSPVKSPSKQAGSNGISSTSTSRTSTPPISKRPSTTTAAATKSRPSLAASTSAAARPTARPPAAPSTNAASRPSLAPPSAAVRLAASRNGLAAASSARPSSIVTRDKQRLSSTTEEATSEGESEQPDVLSPKESEKSSEISHSKSNGAAEEEKDEDNTVTPVFAPAAPPPPAPADTTPASPTFSRPRRPSSPAAASVHSQRTIRSTTVSSRQIEELEAKIRLLERKRIEDRDVKKNLEQARQERDQYKGIIEKLQTKYRPQQQEIAELKRALSEAEKKVTDLETTQAEHDGVVEMTTLDREMAEEAAEGLKAELDALRAQHEEVQLELDILKEENHDLTKEMNPEERESAGWVQLQHSNDRLRIALLALRDRSLDEKEEMKSHIQGLEDQLKDLEPLKNTNEETREKLLRSEADTEDLRQQLEAALQAEEMIEELTERNGRLESTVGDMRIAIEDLENLKELNDELEINHMEAEKQMQEEIDFKDSLLLDREHTAKLLQEALDGKDDTIRQFRNLVGNMQADLADMKASKQITETEAKDLEDKSRAMLDLNLRLQTSAAKTQVKAIDLELRKLEAQEASEHLAIVQLFLPEAFHAERNSVLALLRFKRIAFKSNLVHGFMKERVASFGTRGTDEDVFAACDVLAKLTWIAAMADRFVNAVCSCSPAEFAGFESSLHETEPVERALNGYVDALRRDEMKERDMAEELQRSIAVMLHLASLHIKDDLASHADAVLMRLLVLQSQLESAATALQTSKVLIETNVPRNTEEEDDDEGSVSDLTIILSRADTLINHARSAKVAMGKAHRALADLQARSLTLEASTTDGFEKAETLVSNAAAYTRRVGAALQACFGEAGRIEPFTAAEVAGVFSSTATAVFSLDTPEAGPFNELAKRMRQLVEILADLAALPNDLDNTIEFERAPPPWVARANELKQTKITSIDTEAELASTLAALRSKDTEVKEKETELEEQSVRIEMLEARMKDAAKRSARIAELEKALHEARDAERKARQETQRAKDEQEREMDRAREEMGRLGEERRKGLRGLGGDALDDAAMGAGTRMTVQRQEHKLRALEGAVRHLGSENHRLRLPPVDSPLSSRATLAWLHEPLTKPAPERRRQAEKVRQEGRDVMRQLLDFAALSPMVVELKDAGENRLAWRPARESGRWKVERRKEEWEVWKDWRRDVVRLGGRAKG